MPVRVPPSLLAELPILLALPQFLAVVDQDLCSSFVKLSVDIVRDLVGYKSK